MSHQRSFALLGMSPQLLVTDLNNSIKFYTEQLGFELDFKFEDFYAGIIKDGYTIHLKSGDPSKEERNYKQRHHHLDLLFYVEDIEELYDELLSKPIEIVQPLRKQSYGTEFYLIDPDGYMISYIRG